MASKMAPSTSLLSLPPEIFVHIASLLPAADQASLCATSKAASDFIEPLLWKDIELHDDGFHDKPAELKDPPPFTAPSSRRYLTDKDDRSGNRSRRIAFFSMLDAMYKIDRTRFQHLTARICSLCTVIDYTQPIDRKMGVGPRGPFEGNNAGNDDLMWNLCPHMVNLEVLELHAEWPGAQYKPTPFDGNLPILSRLRFAKLFGYIPQDFARYVVLGSAPTLERLELGLLDRPISQYWRQKDWRTGPLPSERVDRRVSVGLQVYQSTGEDEEVEDNGDFDKDHEDDGNHSSNADSDDNSDGDSSSEYGSLDGEDNLDGTFCYLAPRPLSVSILNTDGPPGSVKFPKLKHLYLCKPIEGEVDNSMYEVIYSSRARGACAYEWFWLLHGAKETLETLVLEHRTCVVAPEFYVPSSFFIKQNSVGWDESYFLGTTVPVFFTEDDGFERLKRVALYGILVGDDSSLKERHELVTFCQQRNIQCEAHIGTICEFQPNNGLCWWVNQGDDPEGDELEYLLELFCEPLKRSEIIWSA